MTIKFSQKWMEGTLKQINLARKIAKKTEKNETMSKNVEANCSVDEAILNIDNSEAKLYEKAIAAMTVEDNIFLPFSALLKTALSHNIVPNDELQKMYDAEMDLISAKNEVIKAINLIAEEKANEEE